MIQPTDIITIHPPLPPSGVMVEEDGTISIAPPSSEIKIPSCELIIDGKPTGQRVAGCVLEAALKCDVGYLVFLTENCPFEESLDIHLVDLSGVLQDSVCIGGMYTTGTFCNLQIQQPDKLLFEFIDKAAHKNGTIWLLKILPKPSLHLPFFSDVSGVKRAFGLIRHFSITANPRTEPH